MASIELNRENQNYIFMEWTSGLYGNNRNMLKNKMFYNVDTINQFKCIKYYIRKLKCEKYNKKS